MSPKIVLAYSGGLDTSVAIHWMREKYGVDIVTLTLDVGQADDLAQIETKSKDVGAVGHHTLDVKREFVEDYVFPSIKANGLYEWKYPVSTALARPLIARKTCRSRPQRRSRRCSSRNLERMSGEHCLAKVTVTRSSEKLARF